MRCVSPKDPKYLISEISKALDECGISHKNVKHIKKKEATFASNITSGTAADKSSIFDIKSVNILIKNQTMFFRCRSSISSARRMTLSLKCQFRFSLTLTICFLLNFPGCMVLRKPTLVSAT